MEHTLFRFRWRAVLASAAASSMLFPALSASAALTHYTDVEAGAWYEESAAALLSIGALNATEAKLRPNDLATRAEVFKLLVDLNGRTLEYPAKASFSDVSKTAWYFPYVEAAATAGWVRGDNSCYGQGLAKCTARPNDRVNRAEMAIMLQRAFALSYLNAAPKFPDVQTGQWYFTPVQTAADHCILQGDGNTGFVRPAAFMNRAEMIVMFHRADQNLRYGEDCGIQPEPAGSIGSVNVLSEDLIRVTFNVDLDPNREDDMDRYMLERTANGANVDIDDLTVINARTVELGLGSPLTMDMEYRLDVDAMRTRGGAVFSDSETFTSDEGAEASIESVTVRADDMLRVRFTRHVMSSRADDIFRYSLERVSNSADVGIGSIAVIDDQTVDIRLLTPLAAQTSYRLHVIDMIDKENNAFSDDFTFSTSQVSALTIESVSVPSASRLRLQFSDTVDEATAELESHYTVTHLSGGLSVSNATRVSANTVELTLGTSLQSQQSYTVTVTNLEGEDGRVFSDSETFVYNVSTIQFDAVLSGTAEVPSVTTTATGTGAFTLTSTGLQYDITVRGLSGSAITGAHFHRGAVGVSGPVVEPISFGGDLHASGTWIDLTAQERDDLLNGRIYVNVHTNAYPNGEIRGQVVR